MWSLLLAHALLGGGGGTPDVTVEGRVDEGSAPRLDGWEELDRAITALTTLDPDSSPFSYGILLRAFFTTSPAEAKAVNDDEDVSGNVLEDADAYFAYREGDVAWRLSADFDSGEPELEDAWARWQHWPGLALSAGQFKPRVTRSGSVPPDEMLFRERTFLGAAFDDWDDGVELGGHYDQWDYWLSVTDGANGEQSDHFASARVEWALYDSAFADREGARGSPNLLRALLGVCWFQDASQSNSDGDGYGGDLALTFGPYAFHAEWADLGEEFARTIDVFNGFLITLGDGQPRSATLSRLVGDEAEVAARYENADDVESTEAFGVAASWMPGGGPARFVADVQMVEGDTRDFSLFSVGIVLGTSGLTRPYLGARLP